MRLYCIYKIKCRYLITNVKKNLQNTYIKKRKKMKKWQIESSKTSEILEISEKLFRVFLFPSFHFCSTAKFENLDLKILEKKFRDFLDIRSPRIFDLAVLASH